MTKFIDFVPKRPQTVVEAHPVMKKPIASAPRQLHDAPKKPNDAPKKSQNASKAPQEAPKKPETPSHGLRIDFVRRPSSVPPRAPQVKAKKTIQISIASKPVIKPLERPVEKPVKKPTPVVEEDDLDDVEPLMEDEELSLALADFADNNEEESPSLLDKLSKEASDLEDELNALDELDAISDDLEAEIADFVEEPKPLFDDSKSTPDTPDTNKYSLGGRSPFLSSVKVEKRPLSGLVPTSTRTIRTEAKAPIRNTYRAKIKQVISKEKDSPKPESKPARRHETTIISTPESHSHTIGLAIAITLTIILGALIGAVLYLIFFQ